MNKSRKRSGIASARVDWNAVGRRLRELRGFDLTQQEFARLIGVSQNHLSTMERGKVEIGAEILLRIGLEFGKDQRRLRAAIRSSWELTTSTYNSKSRTSERSTRQLEGSGIIAGEDEWINKYRDTLIRTNPPRRLLSSVGLGALALGALLVAAIYALHVCLLR